MPCPEMSEWIRIRIKDFYKDTVGETEYTYVSHEVYEALTDLFRREEHAEEMRDLLFSCWRAKPNFLYNFIWKNEDKKIEIPSGW